MNSQGALPKYLQLSELLIREIAAGRLIDGQRLPTERDMAQDFDTSVGTLRKALSDLEDKGLLERVQGSGNYIRHAGETDSIYAMFRLELLDGGGLPSAIVLSLKTMAKPDDLPDFGTAQTASRIRRLRLLNNEPIALEEIWLDASAGILTADMLSDSLYRTYRTRLKFWITKAEDRVSVADLPNWVPPDFVKGTSGQMGFVQRLSWSGAALPVEYSRTWFDPAKAVYVQRLK